MKSSHKAAVCGMITALSVAAMFCAGIVPMASYAIPAFCSALLVVVVIELGNKQAMLVYAAVSLISILLTPNREASVAYILFLGYYPVAKSKIERLHSRAVEFFCKLGVFVFAIAALFALNVLLVGWEAVLGMGPWLLGIGAVGIVGTCFLYDLCLTLLVPFYLNQIRPKYLKRFFR